MRSSSPIVFAAALLLCCAAPAGTQPATDPDLEKGIDLAQRGYFEESIGVLKRVATRLKTAGGDPDQRARTYLYLAVAHHGLGQGETATSLYVEAINTDRSLEISVDEFPPRIVQFFEDARREALASGQIRIAEPAPTPGPAPTPEPAAEAPSAADVRLSPLAAGSPLIFKKVDLLRTFGDEVKKFDARLTLDPLRREIVISDEKHKGDAWATYARIPYHAVIELRLRKVGASPEDRLFEGQEALADDLLRGGRDPPRQFRLPPTRQEQLPQDPHRPRGRDRDRAEHHHREVA